MRQCHHFPAAWKNPCTARSHTPTSESTNMPPSNTCFSRSSMIADAASVMRACDVDLERLRAKLTNYLDNELTTPDRRQDGEDAKPTAGFQRVIQRAVIHVQSSGRDEVTGANVLVAIFSERESHAAYFLQEQDMTRSTR